MRILLPPSETKLDGTHPTPVDPAALVAPELSAHRLHVLTHLADFCATPSPRVREAIGVTVRQDAELVRNAQLRTAPTSPAHAIYTGVLFDALAFAARTPAVRTRLVERVLVQSALFGVVGFGDAIPAYRCSADSTLPEIGRLSAYWRERLPAAMDAVLGEELVVDMRSGAYAAMWQPPLEQTGRVAVIRVMQLRNGRRLAVSHANKATKGHVAAALCATKAEPRTPAELARLLERRGFEVHLQRGAPVTLEVLAV